MSLDWMETSLAAKKAHAHAYVTYVCVPFSVGGFWCGLFWGLTTKAVKKTEGVLQFVTSSPPRATGATRRRPSTASATWSFCYIRKVMNPILPWCRHQFYLGAFIFIIPELK
jgi:hypothetical protein